MKKLDLAGLLMAALSVGCGGSTLSAFAEPTDSGTSGDVAVDAAPADTTPPSPGDLGAPCKADSECLSKLCLEVGRCSKACNGPGICPNSTNWTCLVLPLRGPMCECDLLSKTEIPCNGLDDNCDGKIDEGSPLCAGKCVDVTTDPNNCGACSIVCGGGTTCVGGKCLCPADKPTVCGTSCVDTNTDAANCGSCGKPCEAGSACAGGACKKASAVDVTILLDVTGSTQPSLDKALPFLKTNLATPLLAIPDVQVGVSYTCEFPISPYGTTGDQAFTGGIEPTTVEANVLAALTTFTKGSGGDAPDGMIEAFGVLSGTTPHPTSKPLTCSAGRVAGGCWRADSKKVIVLFTDDIFHNGPALMGTGLYEPYTTVTPAPVDWPAVLKAMLASKVTLLIMSSAGTTSATTTQHQKILTDLGQPLTDIYVAGTGSETASTAADAILARIKAIKAGG